MSALANNLQSLLLILNGFLQSTPQTPELEYENPSCLTAATGAFSEAENLLQGDDRFWTAPFVVADREKREIIVWGEHTGMKPREPVEFFVIGPNSGNDYEAIMRAFAKPSDLHAALLEIGLNPGRPVNPDQHHFWPRGDRVTATFEWIEAESKDSQQIPVEHLVLENDQPMKLEPWVFTGSPRLPLPNQPQAEPVYAADAFSPNSIASTFNLRNTVFDLPRQGNKTQTYGTFIRSPQGLAPTGTPLLLRIKPAPAGTFAPPRDWHLTLRASAPELELNGDQVLPASNLEELGAGFHERSGEEHFLTVHFGEDMTLHKILPAARKLQLMEESLPHVHIDPPEAGRMYYRAFLPDPGYRNRTRRPSQPIELHLKSTGAVVMELTEIWGDQRQPDVVEKRIPVALPEDWIRYLDELEEAKPVLFVYAPDTMPHSELLRWVQPVLDRFPVIYVYTSDPS